MKIFSLFFTHREIIWNLVNKNLRSKYAGSFLGMLWAFINPLLLALIISFVFTNILRMSSANFYLYILSGLLPWTFFAGSLQEAAMSIPAHAAVLKQFPLPREIIPLSAVLANFVIFLAGLLAVLPLFIMADVQRLIVLPLLGVALITLFLFTLGLSLVLSGLSVQWRDITHMLNTFLTFWLWLTPVFYAVDIVPTEFRVVIDWNPFYPFLMLFRAALLNGVPWDFVEFCISIALSMLALFTGAFIFLNKEDKFLQRI